MFNFKDLSVGRKLGIGFGIVLMLLIVIVAVACSIMQRAWLLPQRSFQPLARS